MEVHLKKEQQIFWKRDNYVIAGIGLLFWLLPGLLYLLHELKSRSLKGDKRHRDLLPAIQKQTELLKSRGS